MKHQSRHTGRSQGRGFTLVELLIVIVVVAILAGISVVAYNGIQQRAQTAAIVSTVRGYASIFEMYAATHGRFPPANWQCIGGVDGLPAEDGYDAGYCFKPSSPTAGDNPSSTAVEAAIREFSSSPPSPLIPEIQYNSVHKYRGIIFDAESGTNNYKAVIEFFIPGAPADCPIGKRVSWNYTYKWTRCDYPLSTNSHGT